MELYYSLKLRWRRAAKVRMHVALRYSVILATAVSYPALEGRGFQLLE
jgi:hypothetical protein